MGNLLSVRVHLLMVLSFTMRHEIVLKELMGSLEGWAALSERRIEGLLITPSTPITG